MPVCRVSACRGLLAHCSTESRALWPLAVIIVTNGGETILRKVCWPRKIWEEVGLNGTL